VDNHTPEDLISSDFSGQCYYCERIFGPRLFGRGVGKRTKDHVNPKILGGTNGKYNIVPCCTDCNKDKGGFFLHEWEVRLMNDRWVSRMWPGLIDRIPTILENIRKHPIYKEKYINLDNGGYGF
jgi:hypothetical protein